jgi:tRNA U38,U39,U40 pseudouridine synthase TruA
LLVADPTRLTIETANNAALVSPLLQFSFRHRVFSFLHPMMREMSGQAMRFGAEGLAQAKFAKIFQPRQL